MNRDFVGLFLMKIINVTTSVRNNKKRRYVDAIINGSDRITLKIPERIEWQNLQGNQHLLVEKSIHLGDDGTKLALLDVVLRTDDFAEQEVVECVLSFGFLGSVWVRFAPGLFLLVSRW